MRVLMVSALLLATIAAGIAAEARWVPAGAVLVNGKKLDGVQYLKSGRHMVFPVLAIATALAKTATFDATTRTVTWEGRIVATPGAVVVDGTPYVAWKDMVRLAPVLEYGVRPDAVVFSSNGRPQAPKPGAAAQPVTMEPGVVVINASSPGQTLDVRSFLVANKYNIVEFYSEF